MTGSSTPGCSASRGTHTTGRASPTPSSSACQDNQLASDGDVNGLFTAHLLKVWNEGQFEGGYRSFHRAIQRRMPAIQSPDFYLTGEPAASFLRQERFTV
ncbi:hypothetical protein ACFWCB_32230 [Streptomyces sp. NPDC060048]|uniref:hypothetical protein n=1 Tax=unclassified Streptomyces TaxID=2593676 RepID=UPI00369FD315